MIKYALACDQDHAFEGWFARSADFDDQQAKGLVDCPVCGSRTVQKQIMAPNVAGTKKRGGASLPALPGGAPAETGRRAMMMEVMAKVRAHVEDSFDYV